MSAYEAFIAKQERFRCEPLSAFLTVDQCQVNRLRKDNPQYDVWAVAACVSCPGILNLNQAGDTMAKVRGERKACSVDGCDKLGVLRGKCNAHAKGVDPRPARGWNKEKPAPEVAPAEFFAADSIDAAAERLTDMRTALIRKFESGATRSSAAGKPEYAGYLSPRVIEAFGRYMFEHQLQADGTVRDCRNWQKGIPLESYMQSMFRHFMEVWLHYEAFRGDSEHIRQNEQEIIASLMALLFNVQGMSHEIMRGRCD